MSERPDPTDELITGSGYTVGTFTCGPDDWRWSSDNWVGPQRHVVFPGTPVWILPFGADPLLGTANHVLCYDGDVEFRRRLHAPDGDRCSFLRLEEDLAETAGFAASSSPAVTGGIRATSLDPVAFARHRRILAAARSGADPLWLDEQVYDLLRRLTAAPVPPTAGPAPNRELVEQVKALLAASLPERLTVPDIARAVHYSPYHLSRMFRRATGYSLHSYRQHLRLRAAFDLLRETDRPIGDIGVSMGFDSHSHFTRTFRRTFGHPPAAVRSRAA